MRDGEVEKGTCHCDRIVDVRHINLGRHDRGWETQVIRKCAFMKKRTHNSSLVAFRKDPHSDIMATCLAQEVELCVHFHHPIVSRVSNNDTGIGPGSRTNAPREVELGCLKQNRGRACAANEGLLARLQDGGVLQVERGPASSTSMKARATTNTTLAQF